MHCIWMSCSSVYTKRRCCCCFKLKCKKMIFILTYEHVHKPFHIHFFDTERMKMHVLLYRKSLCPRNFIVVCVSHDPISGQIPFISQVWFKVRKVRGNCVWLYNSDSTHRDIHTQKYVYQGIRTHTSYIHLLLFNIYWH